MNYPTHFPAVHGRQPDPYYAARDGLERVWKAQERFGAWLESQPAPVPVHIPLSEGRAFRYAFLALAVVVSVVTFVTELVRLMGA
jgi:hypothetical protein